MSAMTLPPARGWASLKWFLDTNVIDDPDADELRGLRDAGWIALEVADTALVEVLGADNLDKRAELRTRVEDQPIAMGPLVLGHSLLGFTVLGTDADAARLDAVFEVLWPGSDREVDGRSGSSSARRRLRDALHVATAIRYGGSGFVTRDNPVLRRAEAVSSAFERFPILSVDQATARSLEAIRRVRREAVVMGFYDPASLPGWPS